MIVITLFVGLVAAVLLLPSVSDLVSLLRLGIPKRRPPRQPGAELPRLLFLVPAHDEEHMIESCVRSLVALRYPAERFQAVVIADNCTDRTAEVVRAAGVRCLERHDRNFPGKPRAIAWALTELPVEAFDAVIIIDADTIVDPGFGSALAAAGPVGGQAFQAYFDVRNPADSPLTQMATVLAAANYRFAYALKRRVGLNAPLLGNGMCLGTAVLAAHGWKAFTIAEDWELYTFYTTQGVPIESLETAHLYSQEARSFRQSATQRQRWTAGKLTVLARLAGRLLRSREIGPAQKLDAAAELTSLGPVVHLGLVIGVGVLTAVLRPPGADWLLMALVASVARLAIYTIAGLTVQPNPLRSVVAFAFLPFYLMWRVWMAAASVKMLGDKPWVRTARE
ncbi:MAG TPA: glycosyltransferase family 2 protein [Gemmatimonadales bacterium]|jgi:cellulose synthase/poly-beta-1,6-N-acetylglucosamine synthase-like glycosyltransferase|nr:glycosyltransferase family 2 protein [Gemmatimonadales bacterium]